MTRPTRDRLERAGIVFAMVVAVVLGVVSVSACGAGGQRRDVRTAFDALSSAQAGFVAYDKAHEQAIVAGAKTEDEGKTLLAAWRKQSDDVVHGFDVAYAALALASLDPTPANLAAAVARAADVYQAVLAMKGALSP